MKKKKKSTRSWRATNTIWPKTLVHSMISPSMMTTTNQQQKHTECYSNELNGCARRSNKNLWLIISSEDPMKWCALVSTAANTHVSPFVHQHFVMHNTKRCCCHCCCCLFFSWFWGPIDEKCWLLPWWKWFRLSSGSMHINWRYVYFATGFFFFFGLELLSRAFDGCMQSKQSDIQYAIMNITLLMDYLYRTNEKQMDFNHLPTGCGDGHAHIVNNNFWRKRSKLKTKTKQKWTKLNVSMMATENLIIKSNCSVTSFNWKYHMIWLIVNHRSDFYGVFVWYNAANSKNAYSSRTEPSDKLLFMVNYIVDGIRAPILFARYHGISVCSWICWNNRFRTSETSYGWFNYFVIYILYRMVSTSNGWKIWHKRLVHLPFPMQH